jgi:hypothetical protein
MICKAIEQRIGCILLWRARKQWRSIIRTNVGSQKLGFFQIPQYTMDKDIEI